MKLHDDLEDCEDFEEDSYGYSTTTVARARLCGNCEHYKLPSGLLTCIRCTLDLRPQALMDEKTKKWVAKCDRFSLRI